MRPSWSKLTDWTVRITNGAPVAEPCPWRRQIVHQGARLRVRERRPPTVLVHFENFQVGERGGQAAATSSRKRSSAMSVPTTSDTGLT